MKLVLDTNVLVAAFIAHGTCNELLEHCALHHEIVLSTEILDELEDVLTTKFSFTRKEAKKVSALLKSRAALVPAEPLRAPVCRDPDDDSILATALSGQCVCIVSGDKDLLDIGTYEGIRIVSPSSFWQCEEDIAEHRAGH